MPPGPETSWNSFGVLVCGAEVVGVLVGVELSDGVDGAGVVCGGVVGVLVDAFGSAALA
jgi:hypothetical protein